MSSLGTEFSRLLKKYIFLVPETKEDIDLFEASSAAEDTPPLPDHLVSPDSIIPKIDLHENGVEKHQ